MKEMRYDQFSKSLLAGRSMHKSRRGGIVRFCRARCEKGPEAGRLINKILGPKSSRDEPGVLVAVSLKCSGSLRQR